MNVEEFLKHDLNRRQFLGRSAQNAAGVAAGVVGFTGTAAAAARLSASERVSVGVIGVRNRGKALAETLAGMAEANVVTLCDVDQKVLSEARRSVEDLQAQSPRAVTDFRRVLDDPAIDAVVIAAPDHWHAIMTVLACQAGKDVYVEKPLAHNVTEGAQMVAAAAQHGTIVQAGLQQRSGLHFQAAIDFIQSGQLGTVKLARAWTVHRRKPIGSAKTVATPPHVDYDMWLGPARQRRFRPNRFHFNWRWYWDFGTGELGNWGVHMLDVARWGLGVGLPERVASAGGRYHVDDDQETPDTQVVTYTYPTATLIWEHRHWSTHGQDGRSTGVAFYGEKGTLIVDRGGWKVYDTPESLSVESAGQMTRNHLADFLAAVKTRQPPLADLETAHLSTALCHYGNIAHRVGHEVKIDPETGRFTDDDRANALLRRTYRKKWTMPGV